MESKAKAFGHPVHPMLIVFPLGLLATSVIFDVIHLAGGGPGFSRASFYMIAAGVVGGLLAAVFGLVDWLAIPKGTRAKRVGAAHGLGNVVVTLLFIVSWGVRYGDPDTLPGAAFGLSLVAAALALVTGWLGGELVDRLAVGVDDGAHLDSPSSLSRRAASEKWTPGEARPLQPRRV
jgi:uncharacterized membrane protein